MIPIKTKRVYGTLKLEKTLANDSTEFYKRAEKKLSNAHLKKPELTPQVASR